MNDFSFELLQMEFSIDLCFDSILPEWEDWFFWLIISRINLGNFYSFLQKPIWIISSFIPKLLDLNGLTFDQEFFRNSKIVSLLNDKLYWSHCFHWLSQISLEIQCSRYLAKLYCSSKLGCKLFLENRINFLCYSDQYHPRIYRSVWLKLLILW